jgi:hypothetical protein
MRRFAFIGLLLFFTAQAATPRVFTPFAGKWAGFLEYEDFKGTGRVKISVKLEVRPLDATTAVWDFVYDDFGRPVPSLETHTWKSGTYRVQTKGQSEVQVFTSADFANLLAAGKGKAVLIGTETEVGRKVDVRRTITLNGSKLVTLKETRPKGEVFKFRNQSTYTKEP